MLHFIALAESGNTGGNGGNGGKGKGSAKAQGGKRVFSNGRGINYAGASRGRATSTPRRRG